MIVQYHMFNVQYYKTTFGFGKTPFEVLTVNQN